MDIAVIIAAYMASGTIGRAVRSALAQSEVREVIVVDDASPDATADVAKAADDGTRRLKILRQSRNQGPSAARNLAIQTSEAPFIAILDADDFFLPGRFSAFSHIGPFDLAADNIAFVLADELALLGEPGIAKFDRHLRTISLADFIAGNISIRGRKRGELGFLKPLISRTFLSQRGLQYRSDIRLGEDYELYVRCLALGARFKLIDHCGYVAVERPDSLSGRHRTEDLERLCRADFDILDSTPLPHDAEIALRQHAEHIRAKFEHRLALDIKGEKGVLGALRHIAQSRYGTTVLGSILLDKMEGLKPPSPPPSLRYLFSDASSKLAEKQAVPADILSA